MTEHAVYLTRDGAHLRPYAPGDGFIHFSWAAPSGDVTGEEVTIQDVEDCLRCESHAHFKTLDYRIVRLAGKRGPVLAAPITRLSEKKLIWGGRVYSYRCNCPDDVEVTDHTLSLRAGGHEVRSLSTRAAVIGYLNHEEELLHGNNESVKEDL